MLVALRTLELLVLFTAVGFPVNLLLLSKVDGLPAMSGISARVVLAPITGFAVLTIGMSWFMAARRPVNEVVGPVWVVLVLLWLGVAVCLKRADFRRPACAMPDIVPLALIVVGLLATLGVYLRPFVQDPSLVFWHYAGSDGYEYMQIADYIGSVGIGTVPDVGLRDGALGFAGVVVSQMTSPDGVGDKPGTFATLAGLAAFFRVLPHELFSPLTLAGIALLYLALVVYGSSLHLSVWSGIGLALLGSLGIAVSTLATNTFLANVLALHLFPLLLVLVPSMRRWQSAAFAGLLFGVEVWLFPDGVAMILGMTALLTGLLIWRAGVAAALRSVFWRLATALLVAGGVVLPLAGPLARTGFRRFNAVLLPPAQLLDEGPRIAFAALHPLPGVNWVWPAFNLNVLPAAPLRDSELPFVVLFAAIGGVFVAISAMFRRTVDLLLSLVGLILLLLAGVLGGLFVSDYELFRALVVYAFCPIAALFVVLEWAMRLPLALRWSTLSRAVIALGTVVVLFHFVMNDRFQFGQAYAEHLADAQYTQADIRDRLAIGNLGATSSVVLSTETPTFTGLANELMLLSPARPAVPNAFYKFLFFGSIPPPDVQYASDLVVVNKRYADISEAIQRRVVYDSTDFMVAENDLVPFFDNDTFPMLHALPRLSLVKSGLSVSRVLSASTDVMFFSRSERLLRVSLRFSDDLPVSPVRYSLDGGPWTNLAIEAAGAATVPTFSVSLGLHRLSLAGSGEAAHVQSLIIQVVE